MKRWQLLLVIGLLLSACCPITSKHPLAGLEQAVYDDRLTGTWKAPEEAFFLHIGKADVRRVRMVAVEHQRDSGMQHSHFTVHTVRLGEKNFFNLDLKQIDKQQRGKHSGFLIAHYEFPDPDTLIIRHWSKDAVIAAVKDKKLAGKFTYTHTKQKPNGSAPSEIECVEIVEGSAKLTQFLSANDPQTFFDADEIRLLRVK
jgi:hypothetical protein